MIRVWNAATGEPLLSLSRSGWTRNAVFSADGRTLYSCGGDDKVYFEDATTGRELAVLTIQDPKQPKFKPSGSGLHLSDDHTRLTTFYTADARSLDTLLTVFDVATRKQLLQRRRVDDTFWHALTADGRTLAAAHAGNVDLNDVNAQRPMGMGPMRLEDVASGETLLTFPNVMGATRPLAFSPDGRLLVSFTYGSWKAGKPDVKLRLWEVLSATELRTFEPYPDPKVAFSADGHLLALTIPQGEILLLDLFQAKDHQRIQGFNAQVASLAFSPDSRRLVSGLSDTTLLVWDVLPRENTRGKLSDVDVAKAWKDLAGRDAPRAFAARAALASAPESALALVRKHLHPAQAADPQRLRRLLTDLESEDFAVREKAQTELVELGELAESALRKALEDKPSLEVRRRVQTVLERMRTPVTQAEKLRSLRAVAVLEDIGTAETRRLLDELAQGAPETRLTREVKAALNRLALRSATR
jgi:WD40 repeat protein